MGTIETTSRILVALDGSARDTTAIAEAAKLAAGLSTQVTLLRVIRPPREGYAETPGDLVSTVDLAERGADFELRAYQAAFGGLAVTRSVLVGRHPDREIIGWLRSHPVDFVLMASGGKSRLRRLFAGSVTEAVRRSRLAPVIAIDSARPERDGRSGIPAGEVGLVGAAPA